MRIVLTKSCRILLSATGEILMGRLHYRHVKSAIPHTKNPKGVIVCLCYIFDVKLSASVAINLLNNVELRSHYCRLKFRIGDVDGK